MIQIEGLSSVQIELANRMWALEDTVDINGYIDLLPKRLRGQARFVREMMVAAVLDQVMDTDLAEQVIDSVR